MGYGIEVLSVERKTTINAALSADREVRRKRLSNGTLIVLYRARLPKTWDFVIHFEVGGRRRMVMKSIRNKDLARDFWTALTAEGGAS